MRGLCLTSCNESSDKAYKNLEDCEKDYTPEVCSSAYASALKQDNSKTSRTLDGCKSQYNQCVMWGDGYAPMIAGFIVQLPDDGYPIYEKSQKDLCGRGF